MEPGVRPIAVRGALTLALVAALFVVDFLVLRTMTEGRRHDARTVSDVGRSRMASQRLAVLAQGFCDGSTEDAPLSPAARAELSDSLATLQTAERQGEATRAFVVVVQRFLAAEAPCAPGGPLAALVLATARGDVLRELDDHTSALAAESAAQMRRLSLAQAALLGLSLLVVLALGLLVFRPIVRELDTETRGLRLLNATLEDRVAERTRALEDRSQELARSNADLAQFAYVASHDLKAPLRGIENLVQWLREDLAEHLTDETREHLNLMSGRTERMGRLLDGLLAYSRVGRKDGAAELIDVRALIDDVVDLLALPEGFRVEVEGALPTLLTPRAPLEQVFRNLIDNAVKHHDQKSGVVAVSARPVDGVWTFTVRDDGPGIADRYHEKVFQMFQTLRPRDEVEGSGLGLALIKKIVTVRGGDVWIAPATGRGTSIVFSWPLRGVAVTLAA